METTELNFECTHNTAEGSMTCSWMGGRVRLVEHFATATTCCVIDGDLKCRRRDMTVEQFMHLQVECQKVANGMEGGAL